MVITVPCGLYFFGFFRFKSCLDHFHFLLDNRLFAFSNFHWFKWSLCMCMKHARSVCMCVRWSMCEGCVCTSIIFSSVFSFSLSVVVLICSTDVPARFSCEISWESSILALVATLLESVTALVVRDNFWRLVTPLEELVSSAVCVGRAIEIESQLTWGSIPFRPSCHQIKWGASSQLGHCSPLSLLLVNVSPSWLRFSHFRYALFLSPLWSIYTKKTIMILSSCSLFFLFFRRSLLLR